jgi:hypothetical protein
MAEANKSNKNASTNPAVEEDDFYDEATEGFAKVEHLAPSLPPNFGPGRLVAIWAISKGLGKAKNPQNGKTTYPYVNTVTLVLDDGPEGISAPGWDESVATLVPAAPQRLDGFQHSTGQMVPRLERRLTAKNAKDVPLRFRPYIGRMNTQASQNNKNVASYGISEMTDEDKAIVLKYKDMIKAINAEMEAAELAAQSEDNADTVGFE